MKKTVIATATALLVASSVFLPLDGIAGGDKKPPVFVSGVDDLEQQVKDLDAKKRLVRAEQRQRQIEAYKKEQEQIALASRGEEIVQTEWRSFVATFYTLSEGSGTGRTATGTIPTAHKTLAVDPNVIPLGSVVEIKYPSGYIEQRIAEDTGGAIRGNVLDVYVVTVNEALSRGRQHVQLRIIR